MNSSNEDKFDCSLWLPSNFSRESNKNLKYKADRNTSKIEKIYRCLFFAVKKGGEFWRVIEKAVAQVISEYNLPPNAEKYLRGLSDSKDENVAELLAPFMLNGHDAPTKLARLVRQGLIYDLILKIRRNNNFSDSDSDATMVEKRLGEGGDSKVKNEIDLSPFIATLSMINIDENFNRNDGKFASENKISETISGFGDSTKKEQENEYPVSISTHLRDRENIRKMLHQRTAERSNMKEDKFRMPSMETPPRFVPKKLISLSSDLLEPPTPKFKANDKFDLPNVLATPSPVGKSTHQSESPEADIFCTGEENSGENYSQSPDKNIFDKSSASPKSPINFNISLQSEPDTNVFESPPRKNGSAEIEAGIAENVYLTPSKIFRSLPTRIDSDIFHEKENAFTATMKPAKLFKDRQPLRCCAFAPGDGTFAIGSNSKTLRIFHSESSSSKMEDLDSGLSTSSTSPTVQIPDAKLKHEFTDLHEASIYCLDYSPDGGMIATGSNDKQVKICQIFEEEVVMSAQMGNHDGTIRSVKFLPGPKMQPVLASGGGGDGRLYLTDCRVDKLLMDLEFPEPSTISNLAAPNRNHILAVHNSRVFEWDIRSKKCNDLEISESISSICCNSSLANGDVSIFGTGSDDGIIQLWDSRNTSTSLYTYMGHKKAVRSVAMRGDWMISGSMDNSLALHNTHRGAVMFESLRNERIISVALSHSLDAAITTTSDGTALLWNINISS